jgi:PadR family transcriptional regulator PadR
MAKEGFSGHLDLLLLASLEAQPMHGYALIEHVRERSSGRFSYPEGTVYPALRRLEDQGLVRSRWRETQARRRRIHELTARGSRALTDQQQKWNQYIAGVEAVLGNA